MKKSKELIYICFGILVSSILSNFYLIINFFNDANIDFASKYGDFIAGYFGTSLSFITVVLMYLTFSNQKKANDIERFESKFFDMIKMHRENVSEIKLGDESGRKVFVSLLREYRLIYKVFYKYIKDKMIELSTHERFDICFKIFYYGTGPNSTRMLENSIPIAYKSKLEDFIELINKRFIKVKYMNENDLKFVPFEGHQSRLGHYYRHLFQTVCFVDMQDDLFPENKVKYDYVKILRAQLSTHEQALFYLNSLSDFGKVWRINDIETITKNRTMNLMEEYQLIKNLPDKFFDLEDGIDPEQEYKGIKFEWKDYNIQ